MFVQNEDHSIYCTRGDSCEIPVTAALEEGDTVRFKVFRKKDCNTVVLQRDFKVEAGTNTVTISLTGDDTKFGDVISKPTDYWYEVELNPDTEPHTIIGYDEDGPKVFRLFPEGKDVDGDDIGVVGKKTLKELVDYALEQAKESGEFKGEKGDKGDKGDPGLPGGTDGISFFGYKYSKADKTFDLSAGDKKVTMYLFAQNGGYAAVVSGEGAMKDYASFNDRPYDQLVKGIKAVYIEKGITTIGDFFMDYASNLKDVVFQDMAGIKKLGKYCFAETQITGEYEFCLENKAEVQRSFYFCPNLTGITLDVDAKADRSITIGVNEGEIQYDAAFRGCLNLRYFKIKDPDKTNVILGQASFWYCPSLELIELQTKKTTPYGFNFLMNPTKTQKLKFYDTKKSGTGALAHIPLASTGRNIWPETYDGTPILTTHGAWIDETTDDGTFQYVKYLAYLACQGIPANYAGQRYLREIPECDYQNAPEYKNGFTDDVSEKWADFWGKIYGNAIRVPLNGSCWLFAYYHIWNLLHPSEQYDTVMNFVENKLKTTKINVDTELERLFTGGTWEYYNDVAEKYDPGYFTTANTDGILATDLPVSFEPDGSGYTTIGQKGEASWGVRTVLGWTGVRATASYEDLKANTNAWAEIKQAAIESIFAGKPVIFECVGYPGYSASDYRGLHAVAAIGYDSTTDKFQVIDSAWRFEPDVVPMVYWTEFEAMLEPSEESAVWIFPEFDKGATIVPDPANAIGDALDDIIAKQTALIGG